MNRYPLKLAPVGRTALWGGDRLRRSYGKEIDLPKLAETWELTLRPDAVNRILNGEAAGLTLAEYLAAVGSDAVSPDYDGSRFPLLIKFIDAADRLSVQVHPDDGYARRNRLESGKTEMWYVVEAEPGASLIFGLAPGVSTELFAESVRNGTISSAMREVPVKPGDSFFIPAGMLHAIGRGILVAEIQQNADITYRVWDYERRDAEGKLRALHVREALDVVRPFTDPEVDALRFSRAGEDRDGELLAASEYFTVRRLRVLGEATVPVGTRFRSLLAVSGEGTVGTVPARAGDSFFLPAGIPPVSVCGTLTVLLSEPT